MAYSHHIIEQLVKITAGYDRSLFYAVSTNVAFCYQALAEVEPPVIKISTTFDRLSF